MNPEPSSKTAAVRVSSDEDMTSRIISDSGEHAEPSEPPTRVTLRSQYEPKWLHTITSKYALVLV